MSGHDGMGIGRRGHGAKRDVSFVDGRSRVLELGREESNESLRFVAEVAEMK